MKAAFLLQVVYEFEAVVVVLRSLATLHFRKIHLNGTFINQCNVVFVLKVISVSDFG